MNSLYQRGSPYRTSPASALSILRAHDGLQVSYKLVEGPYVSIHDDYYDNDYDDNEYYHRPRTTDNYYGIRQEYLRSYTFTREEPKPDKLKDSLLRFKTIAWAVICCKFKPSQAKALRERLSSKSSRFFHDSTDLLSASCRKFAVPSCIRFSSVEIA